MINKGNRQQGTPYFIGDNSSMKLQRVPLNEKAFQENWLQELIHNNPQVLPIDEIESGFAPLISLGKEIHTSVGYIDNLFISPNGYLTIVETKLWRNPEAKREVVGQIIDYAKELTTWTFSRLDNSIKSSNNLKGIIELIEDAYDINESQEQTIIDNIERNLKRGRFLLLIVGDGIRESVEDMVDYLSSYSQLQFTLGLVELQVYKNPKSKKDFIVIPNLITRTKEIIRAIIRIENSTQNNIVSVETDFREKSVSKIKNSITEEDFFEQLSQNTEMETVKLTRQILADARKMGYSIYWSSGGFIVTYLDPNGSGIGIHLFIVDRKGILYLMQTGANRLEKLGLSMQIAFDFSKSTADLIENMEQNSKNMATWSRYAKIKEIKPVYTEFINEVERYVENINEESKKANE